MPRRYRCTILKYVHFSGASVPALDDNYGREQMQCVRLCETSILHSTVESDVAAFYETAICAWPKRKWCCIDNDRGFYSCREKEVLRKVLWEMLYILFFFVLSRHSFIFSAELKRTIWVTMASRSETLRLLSDKIVSAVKLRAADSEIAVSAAKKKVFSKNRYQN